MRYVYKNHVYGLKITIEIKNKMLSVVGFNMNDPNIVLHYHAKWIKILFDDNARNAYSFIGVGHVNNLIFNTNFDPGGSLYDPPIIIWINNRVPFKGLTNETPLTNEKINLLMNLFKPATINKIEIV